MRIKRTSMTALAGAFFLTAAAGAAVAQEASAAQATDNLPLIVGVVLLNDPAQVRPEGWPVVLGRPQDRALLTDDANELKPGVLQPGMVDASRLGSALSPDLLKGIETTLYRRMTPEALSAVRAAVSGALTLSGREFAHVSIPEQDSTDGVVQVLVTEGRLGEVTVRGVEGDRARRLADALNAPKGEAIDRAALDRDLVWLNRNPFRRAQVVAQPGAAVGVTDLVLEVDADRPWQASLGVDNSGTAATDEWRLSGGFVWGDAFGRGDILSYQLSATPDFESLVGHSLSYQAFLPWRHVATLSGSYTDIRGDLPDPFTLEGYSWQVVGRYEIPLASARDGFSHAAVFGADLKRSNNNFRFSDLPITESTADVAQLVAGYQLQARDARGATGLSLELVWSPSGVTARNDAEAFRATRVGADPDYLYARLRLDRQTRLSPVLVLSNGLVGQIANEALLGSEQLVFGGRDSVRGFEEGENYGDEGFILRNELALGNIAGRGGHRLLPYLFYDIGYGHVREALPGSFDDILLQSAGAGVTYAVGNLSVRASYGFQIDEERDDGQSGRAHLTVALTF